nr:hypothetical protein [Dyella sp. ASV24]
MAILVLSLLIIDSRPSSQLILAVILAVGFVIDGGLRMLGAWVVRFRGWITSLVVGLIEIVAVIVLFVPSVLPSHDAILQVFIGVGMVLSGLGLARRGWQFHRMAPNTMLSEMLLWNRPAVECVMPPASVPASADKLTIHVWTPSASVTEVIPAPIIDRYIAAVDGDGVISTGHAALECGSDIYVSHYPAVEIDRSSQDFRRVLRATAENNVEGVFQPDYATESGQWCESDMKIRFPQFSAEKLNTFWQQYRTDTTYNLTNRNCSSSVARCLEAALEGSMCTNRFWVRDLLRALINPELWVANQLRRRAESMAWTPGLVLDYSRALSAAIQPAPWGWTMLAAAFVRGGRYAWLVLRGRPIPNVQAMRRKSEADMRKLEKSLAK